MIVASATALVGFVASVFGLASLLAGFIAVAFSQLRRNTTQIVRDENKDLRDRMATLEAAEHDCKARLAKSEVTAGVLSDMVKGTSAVSALSARQAVDHAEVLARLDDVESMLGNRRRRPAPGTPSNEESP